MKLFESQRPPSIDQPMTDYDRDQKAAAIRREIEEAKAAQKEEEEIRKREEKYHHHQQQQLSSPENVEMQSPVESKVKPLKIPMKSKLVSSGNSPGSEGDSSRGVPGTRLRINQPAGQEIKSILRTSKANSLSVEEQQQKRLSIENLPSVKSKIETYLEAAADRPPPQQAEQPSTPSTMPKSILVKNSNKAPRLLHGNEGTPAGAVSIYATSATDMSEEEESATAPRVKGMLEVPNQDDASTTGLRKSRSFTSTTPVAKDKQDTVMAFFGGTRYRN